MGRFIGKDPIGLLGGIDTFAYAPNPISWIDEIGLKSKHQQVWEATHGTLPPDYQVHHIIPQQYISDAKKLCPNFDINSPNNLIALPKYDSTPKKSGAGYGKTVHNGYHLGYSMSVEYGIQVAKRLKIPKMTNCKKLSFLQNTLRKQLESGSVPMYKQGSADSTNEVKKSWDNVLRNGVRGF